MEDLFDRADELKLLLSSVKKPLVILTGLRRTGKTSLMKVGLGQAAYPYVIVDARGIPVNPSKKDVLKRFEIAFNNARKDWLNSIKKLLGGIRGIQAAGFGLSFSWGKEAVDMQEIFDAVNRWARGKNVRFILAIDEVQELRGFKDLLKLLAHIYDYNRQTTVILTGSQVGLLHDFIGIEDASSPLYGRHRVEIPLSKFSPEQSKEFLLKGFEQASVKPDKEVLEFAIEELDGIVGWLTEFGASALEKGVKRKVVDQVIGEGIKLTLKELESLFRASPRYKVIFKTLALGPATWSEVKGRIDAQEGREVANSTFNDLLSNLVDRGYVEKSNEAYQITDSLLRRAARKLT